MTAGVLVVDDEEAVAFTLGAILAQDGFDVEQATSVTDALARIDRRRFDVALLDLRLGDESGLAVLQHLQRVSPDTVAVMLTGYGSLDTAIEAMRLGASDYLHKPCPVPDLKAAITRGLEQRRLAAPPADIDAADEELDRALEQVLRARDDFLAIAAHELKTPLTVIVGWIDYVRRQLARGEIGGVSERLEGVVARARRMARLVDDIVDAVSVVQGALQLAPQLLDLRRGVERAVTEVHAIHPEREIVLHLPDQPVQASVDRRRLERALVHVIENAVKFSPAGGAVHVSLSVAVDEARIEVGDAGLGIPAAELQRIFEQFHQVDANVLTRRFGGLGLGLFLSRAVVEAHGGRIWAQSAGPGYGSAVILALPLPDRNTQE